MKMACLLLGQPTLLFLELMFPSLEGSCRFALHPGVFRGRILHLMSACVFIGASHTYSKTPEFAPGHYNRRNMMDDLAKCRLPSSGLKQTKMDNRPEQLTPPIVVVPQQRVYHRSTVILASPGSRCHVQEATMESCSCPARTSSHALQCYTAKLNKTIRPSIVGRYKLRHSPSPKRFMAFN